MYHLHSWMLFLWALSLVDLGLSENPLPPLEADALPPYHQSHPEDANNVYPEYRERERQSWQECAEKMEKALETVRRRQLALDMYVTDMRVRLPPTKSWVRVDRCNFNPINHSLETKLLFNDLTISGRVNLFNDGQIQQQPLSPNPEESYCSLVYKQFIVYSYLSNRFHTEPLRREQGQFNVKTDSHFLEPGFISVYAYGCEPSSSGIKRRDRGRDFEAIEAEDDEISREMEDVFLRGIRSLLTSYMQKELQHS